MEEKGFLGLEGLKLLCQNIFAKIEQSAFSGNYEDLSNKPAIQTASVDEANEILNIY